MKITLTGSLGNIGKKLTELLVQKNHQVTVISHNPDRKEAIDALGAKASIGNVEDTVFLQEAFTGADAVYLMVPPDAKSNDLKGRMKVMAENYAKAIKLTDVKYVVCLSGIGADVSEGHGVSSALHYLEQELTALLPEVNILFLRPGMFYSNYYGSIRMVKYMGVMGNNFESDKVIVMTHPHDIAHAAATALDELTFSGKKVKYVASDELTGLQIAGILGEAIGKPDLGWIVFKDEDLIANLNRAGFSEHMISNFLEMGHAIDKGEIWDDYKTNRAEAYGELKFKEFAKELAAIYKTL